MKNVMDRVYPFLFRPWTATEDEQKMLTLRDIVSMLHLYGGLPELLELSERATAKGVPAPARRDWVMEGPGKAYPIPARKLRIPRIRRVRARVMRQGYRKELGMVQKDGIPQTPGGLFIPNWGLRASRPVKFKLTVDEVQHLHRWWRDKSEDLTQFQRDILFFWLPPNGFPKTRGLGTKELLPRVIDHGDEERWKGLSFASKASHIQKNIRQMIKHLRKARKEQGL